jgi:CheY-like chemotaxis protein
LKRTPLRDDQREMVNVIGDSGELLLTILNDVLDLAKIESGKFSLKSIEFDLSDSLEAVCALYQDSASQKGLALRTDIEEAAHGVFKGDPVRIRQIIQNFTSNAIKFTEKGEVVVRARRTATGLRISVSDTGIGMNEEQCGRMFRKFEEADNTITRRFGGTGLGLSICKNIAEMMGGAVGVDSVEGRGSTFWFEAPLPYVRESTGRGDVEQDEAEIAYDLRILAADDNAVNRLVSKTLLEQAGLTADFVENGALAVQGAQIQTYDLILMDVHMPEMDGMAATRAIRKLNNSNATIPIIALTADVLPEHVARCREAGMTAHVAKPIKPDILYAAISAAFEAPEVDETKDGTAAA